MLFEWSCFSSHATSEGDRRKFMLPPMIDKDFGEGGADLERPLICKNTSCKMLNVKQVILSTVLANAMKDHISKV